MMVRVEGEREVGFGEALGKPLIRPVVFGQ